MLTVAAAVALTPLIYLARALLDRYLGTAVSARLKEQAARD
jgi:hypothetical protein